MNRSIELASKRKSIVISEEKLMISLLDNSSCLLIVVTSSKDLEAWGILALDIEDPRQCVCLIKEKAGSMELDAATIGELMTKISLSILLKKGSDGTNHFGHLE